MIRILVFSLIATLTLKFINAQSSIECKYTLAFNGFETNMSGTLIPITKYDEWWLKEDYTKSFTEKLSRCEKNYGCFQVTDSILTDSIINIKRIDGKGIVKVTGYTFLKICKRQDADYEIVQGNRFKYAYININNCTVYFKSILIYDEVDKETYLFAGICFDGK